MTVNVVTLPHAQFILVADLLRTGKMCWLTPAELALVNAIRADKGLFPVTVIDKVSESTP